MTTINESTSVIAVKTSQLTAGQTTVVYVSTTSDVGHIATVFDVQGFLSAPQSILVSSVTGNDLGPGISSVKIQQRFGYVTLRSNSYTSWGVVDENAFRTPSTDYGVQGLHFDNGTAYTSNMTASSNVSAITTTAKSLVASNANFFGPLFVSSIGISTNTNTFFTNNLSNTSNIIIQSSISVAQGGNILSAASNVGPMSIQNNMTVGGGFNTTGTMYLQSSLSTVQRILVNSILNTQGQVTVGSNIQCFANVNTSTTVSAQLAARTIVTNNILFDSAAELLAGPNNSLYVSSSLYVPNAIQTSTLNTETISTQALTVLSTIFTPALSLSNALIRNTNGSLVISSIQANTIQYTSLYGSNATDTVVSISTQAAQFSTLLLNDGLYAADTINIPRGYIDNLYSDRVVVNIITSGGTGGLGLDTITLSTIVISSALLATQMSSFVAPGARIITANIATGNIAVGSSRVITSSLTGVASISDTGLFTISTPSLFTSSIAANYISSVFGTTSSLTLSNAVLGPAISVDPNAPYFIPSTFSGLTSNRPSEFIQGIGAPFNPLHIVASSDRDAAAYIVGGPGVSTAYLTMNYSYATTGPSTPGTASIILKNPIVQSTLVTFSSTDSASYQTYSLSNYPIAINFISSIYTYNLTGPMTYATPSTLQSQQTLVAGGQTATIFELTYSSDGGTKWITMPYVGFETATYGISFGDSKWIAVGDGLTNTIIFSYTGTVWYDLGKTVFSTKGLGIAWNGTTWVALGEGTNTVATSSDGITWIGQGLSVFSVRGLGAASNGTSWIAVGQGANTMARSINDGVTWIGQGSTTFSVKANGVAWNGSLWVAVGAGTNTLATSPDGVTWTGQGTTVFQTEGRVVAWNGAYWLAGSVSDTAAQIAYSVNGLTWTKVACPIPNVYSLVWIGTQWIAGGTTGIAKSPDGLVWASSPIPFTTTYALASRAASTFALVPTPLFIVTGTGTNFLATSADGNTWTPRTVPFTSGVNCVAWNGSLWVAGGLGTYSIATSPDGIVWTGISIANITVIYGIAWGKEKWIAVGYGTSGYTRAESTDGITWTPYAYTTGNFFSSAAYGITWAQGIWIAVGSPQGSGILFSLNGSLWIPPLASMFTIGRCVSSNGTIFLAGGGPTNRLAYSLEGSVWAPLSCPMTTQINGIAWGSNVWVAVGQGTNTIAYSYDGVTWIGLGSDIFSVAGTGITWTGAGWIAVGSGTNTIATSLDGITWTGQADTVLSAGRGCAASPILQPNTITNWEEPVGIRWNVSGVAIISPTVIEKPPRTNPGYDSYARSVDGFSATAFLQFRAHQLTGSCFIGLTTATTPLTAISYAFSLTDTGNLEIWEGGYLVAATGPFAISDTFQIIFDGVKLSFQKNFVELLSFSRSPGLPVFLEAQFNLGGTRLYDLEFRPVNQISQTVGAIPNQFYTTSKPTGFLSPPISFQRPIVETVFPPSLWEFAIPMSGTLVTPSSAIYADVYIGTNFLFSTATLQTALTPAPSTYNLSYTLSTPITTTPGDILGVKLYTQHSRGFASIYSTTLTTSIYNLSSVQFVEFIHNTGGTGAQTSDFSLWIQNGTTPFANYVNSNAGLQMNRGFMRWNQRQYGITIQNQYNDLQTRSLTYTGGLFTASDSNLKHDTAYADTGALYDAIGALPLHRYTFIGSWRDRFKTEDANQLGVLTTEVAAKFPSMIKVADSEFVPNLQTVDRVQFRYAHLGATQHIMERLSSLRSKITALYDAL